MRNFNALIFDVDGTIAETEELHRRAFNESFVDFGLDWAWDVALYGRLLRITGGKERISHYLSEYRGDRDKLSAAQIADIHRMKNGRYAGLLADGACQLRPGVADTLDAAKRRGLPLAIATTTSRSNVEALLTPVLGKEWSTLFRAIVAGEDVERKKPAPDVYLEVLARLALPASDCVAIEDSRNGLLAASRAGIPVLITRSVYFRDEDFSEAVLAIDDLTALPLG